MARAAGEAGGLSPCVLNAANEVAVAAFLDGRCRYDEIIPIVSDCVEHAPSGDQASLDDVLAADAWARERAGERLAPGATVA